MALHVALIAVAINLPGRSPDPAAASRPRVEIVFYPEPAPLEPPVEPVAVPVPERAPTPAPEPEPPRERPAAETVAKTIVEPVEPKPVEPAPQPAPPAAVADERPAAVRPEVRTRVFAAAEPEPAEARPPSSDREVRANVFGGNRPAGETAARPERRAVTGIFTTNRGAGDLVVAAAPRAVSPAGFGDGSAAGQRAPAGAARGARVERGTFGDSVVVAPSSRPREIQRPDPEIPVEIVSKPKPVYTEEARRLGIEGEVVLEVTFRASGKLSIHRIIEGLGHGLDEAAVVAARSIAFTPARQDGRPVDFIATLRVVFQLA